MKVYELIAELQKQPPESQIFMAYDSDIVVTTPKAVEFIKEDKQIGSCWHRVNIGDTVILSVG